MFGMNFGMMNLGGIITTVVAAPFVLVLTVINIVLIRSARKASASNRWPSTSGRILMSDVYSHRSLNSSGTHTEIYTPKIQYEYTAEGQRFQSDQLSYSMVAGTSAESWAQGIVDKYPEGSSVQVYYNASKPSEAVLEHSGGGLSSVLVFILGAVELFLIVLIVLGLTGHMG